MGKLITDLTADEIQERLHKIDVEQGELYLDALDLKQAEALLDLEEAKLQLQLYKLGE